LYSSFKKACTCLLIVTALLSSLGFVASIETYLPSQQWDLQNNCYINFNQTTDFAETPHRGIFNDSLVGYWNLNEGSGSIAYDSAGNCNGTIVRGKYVEGKYGQGLYLNGSAYMSADSTAFQISNQFTIQLWVQINAHTAGYQGILTKNNEYMLRFENLAEGSHFEFFVYVNGKWREASGSFVPVPGQYYLLTGVFDNTLPANNLKLYVNGNLTDKSTSSGDISGTTNPLQVGRWDAGSYLNGTVDEIRFYNRALNNSEIAALINPASFDNYYNFKDPATNNTFLVSAYPVTNDNDAGLITCSNFFKDNRLAFQANYSTIVNIWTNLGQPVFTSGVWNSQNYTTTLTLDSSSIGELDWNRVPPSSSNISVTPINAGNVTNCSALWSDPRGLLEGGYIFSSNNTGIWVNSTWAPFSSNPGWGNATLTLNSTIGLTVGFREYANNSLGIWGDSGIYTIKTTAYESNPAPTLTPEATPTSTVPPTINPATPTVTPTSPADTPVLSNKMILIVTSVVMAVLFVFFFAAFSKGYIKIEVVDEKPNESSSDNL
jgi:hypothetical protein